MKQYKYRRRKTVDFRFFTALAVVCLVAAVSLSCQFGDYFSGANSANVSPVSADKNKNNETIPPLPITRRLIRQKGFVRKRILPGWRKR